MKWMRIRNPDKIRKLESRPNNKYPVEQGSKLTNVTIVGGCEDVGTIGGDRVYCRVMS